METKNDTNGKEEFVIGVPDIFHQLLLGQLACARGHEVWVKPRSKTKIKIHCDGEEIESLLRDAKLAGTVLEVSQLEAVVKALESVGEKPSRGLLEMIATARANAGIGDNDSQPLGRIGRQSLISEN